MYFFLGRFYGMCFKIIGNKVRKREMRFNLERDVNNFYKDGRGKFYNDSFVVR